MSLLEVRDLFVRYRGHSGAVVTAVAGCNVDVDEGQIVAGIGYLPYDGRFPQLNYQGRKTVEVVRLFVLPAFRRCGLAGELYRALEVQAKEDRVAMMYLHTHPFLPGAIDFWLRQGFEVVDVDADPVWRTTHMQRAL